MVRKMCRQREDGLTLVELLVAMTLLMFVMLATIPFIVTTMSVNRSAYLKSRAQMFSADRLSQLQFLPENVIPPECDSANESYCVDEIQTLKGVTMTRYYKFVPINTNGGKPSSYIIIMYTYNEEGQVPGRFYIAPWIRK
jgi:Tfp pilus assembly protein PilV